MAIAPHAALSLTLFTTACSGPVVTQVDDYIRAMPSYYDYYAANRTMTVDVRGNPFGDASFPAEVAAQLRPPPNYPPTQFVPAQAGAAPPYRMVLVFGAPAYASGSAVCEQPEGVVLEPGPRTAPAAQPVPVRVQGAVCYRDRVLTEAVGRSEEVPGARSPQFQALLSHMSLALLPPTRHDSDNWGCNFQLGGMC